MSDHLHYLSPAPELSDGYTDTSEDSRERSVGQIQDSLPLVHGHEIDSKTPSKHGITKVSSSTPPIATPPMESSDAGTREKEGAQYSLTGTDALVKILERGQLSKFGFVLFRTYYRDEASWQQFVEEYERILRAELNSAGSNSAGDTHDILKKVRMDIVSDDCMENKVPAHIAFAYRLFEDIEPGLKTKMCLIVDKECIESVTLNDSQSVPFVKAVDVILGADAESAFPCVIKVAISSLLARFYPALANCDTVWEIATEGDSIWKDWPNLDGVV